MTDPRQRTTGDRSSPSYTQRMQERMTRDEAVKAIVRMMLAYPLFRCPEENLLTLAEALMCFPREVATAAASPIHGVPKACLERPPNAGQITEWCEREAAWLRRMARYEVPALPEKPIDRSGRPDLKETIARAAKIMGRTVSPDGTQIGPSAATLAEIEEGKNRQRAIIDRANERVRADLERASVEAGRPVTAWGPLSPSLVETIKKPASPPPGQSSSQ